MDTFTFIFTVAAGVFVFVIGQLLQKAFIEPIFSQRFVVGEIVNNLTYYANVYTSPARTGTASPRYNDAHNKFRELSTSLVAKSYQIPWYSFLSKLGFIPTWENITVTKKALIGISNGLVTSPEIIQGQIENNMKRVDEIKTALNIKFEL